MSKSALQPNSAGDVGTGRHGGRAAGTLRRSVKAGQDPTGTLGATADTPAVAGTTPVGVVVLGMSRSGTSAVAGMFVPCDAASPYRRTGWHELPPHPRWLASSCPSRRGGTCTPKQPLTASA